MSASLIPPALAAAGERLLDVKAVSAKVRCSWRHYLRLADSGLAPAGHKVGARLRRWRESEIDRWIADGCPMVAPKEGGDS